MFNRPHHQRIAHVLSALDGSVLAQNACWFAGGTCIALKFGEYRESVDIDFWCQTPRVTESCANCSRALTGWNPSRGQVPCHWSCCVTFAQTNTAFAL